MNFLDYLAEKTAIIDPHKTQPNPRVGACIVLNGEIMSEGFYNVFGSAHAEVQALENLPGNIKIEDCEIYITLEPCDDFEGKKTPSCTNLLLNNRFKKIIIGSGEPKQGIGQNLEKLKEAGIEVEFIEHEGCRDLNPFLKKYNTTGKPYLCLKIAQSLDGKITGDQTQWITNEFSRQAVHKLRAQYSTVLSTTSTVLNDGARLDCRLEIPRAPFNKGELVPVFSDPEVIIVGQREISEDHPVFQKENRVIHRFQTFEDFYKQCWDLDLDSVLIECGSQLNTYLLKHQVPDEIQIFIAPKILGAGLSVVHEELSLLDHYELVDQKEFAGDVCLVYKRQENF